MNLNIQTINKTSAIRMLILQKLSTDPVTFTPRDIVSIRHALEFDRVIGMFDGSRLIAYSIMTLASEENKFQADVLNVCWKFAGTVVHPDYRGNAIQRKLLKNHIEFIKTSKVKHVMAYVHIQNKASIKSVTGVGLTHCNTVYVKEKQDYRSVYRLDL